MSAPENKPGETEVDAEPVLVEGNTEDQNTAQDQAQKEEGASIQGQQGDSSTKEDENAVEKGEDQEDLDKKHDSEPPKDQPEGASGVKEEEDSALNDTEKPPASTVDLKEGEGVDSSEDPKEETEVSVSSEEFKEEGKPLDSSADSKDDEKIQNSEDTEKASSDSPEDKPGEQKDGTVVPSSAEVMEGETAKPTEVEEESPQQEVKTLDEEDIKAPADENKDEEQKAEDAEKQDEVKPEEPAAEAEPGASQNLPEQDQDVPVSKELDQNEDVLKEDDEKKDGEAEEGETETKNTDTDVKIDDEKQEAKQEDPQREEDVKKDDEKQEEKQEDPQREEEDVKKDDEKQEEKQEDLQREEEDVKKDDEKQEEKQEDPQKKEEDVKKDDEKQDEKQEDPQKKEEDGEKPTDVKNEETTEPPIIKPSSTEETGKPLDFYYNYEEYASGSYVSPDSGIPPNILNLFHSFGYDCRKRCNLCLLPGPTALFAAGNLVHLLDLTDGTHKFLRSCSGGGIGAVTVHPSQKYFAVAEKGTKPDILIYEFPSLKLFRVLKEGTEKAYSFVDYNPNGNLLASVGNAPDFMLTVWDWSNEKIMLRTKAFSQDIFRVKFAPEQEGQLTSSGTGHIRFWKMARTFTGLKLKGELGRFGKTALTDIDGFVQLPDGKVLSGSEWGNLLLWDGGLIKVEICRKGNKSCHQGSIQQLVIDEGELITIGIDGYVRVWELESIDTADTTDESDVFEVEPMNELKVGPEVQLTSMVKLRDPNQTEESDDSMESIWFAQDASGGIWKLDLSFSHTTKPPEKLHSYTAGKIAGMVTSPVSHMVAVTGDPFVRIYDYLAKEVICEYKCPMLSDSTSILWPGKLTYEKCNTILAGFSNGLLRVLTLQTTDDSKSLILQQALKPHNSDVTAIALHHDGKLLATGGKDSTVFFFRLNSTIEPIGFISVPGPVSHLQWSPATFTNATLLVSCINGKVAEISAPVSGAFDTSHSYKLTLPMKYFTFQSVKSQLRRNEARERKRIEKEKKLKEKQKELKRRKDRGEEFSEEEEKEFLKEEEDEEEEKALYFPPTPSPLFSALYTDENKFVISVGDYDAGYLYECEFSSDAVAVQNPDIAPAAPFNALAVPESDDIPVTYMYRSSNARCLLVGFGNGVIRVHPIPEEMDTDGFKIEAISLPFWQMSMHDNETGFVSSIAESHDGAYLFTGGNDGNIYGYHFLPYEEVYKAMEGKRARLPSARVDEELVSADDIDDPKAYSIEDAKLKAEHDRYLKEAEAKKMEERQNLAKLRQRFQELLKKNESLPAVVRLAREEFELDPTLRQNMHEATNKKIERVKLEMQWEKEKLALATRKIRNRFSAMIDCPRIQLYAIKSSHTMASYRITSLGDDYYELEKEIENRSLAAGLDSDTFQSQKPSESLDSGDKDSARESMGDQQSFLQGAVKKQKATTLQGRQAEKVAKALKKAEEAKKKREQRQKEWEDLYKSKPADNYEDPADISAIKEAKANIGDFKLKTSSDYVVPEHLRMDTGKKRTQILILQGLIFQEKKKFNTKFKALRESKQKTIADIKAWVKELKDIQRKLDKEHHKTIPKVPRMKPDELPEKKYEYTRETLLEFQSMEKERELADASKKRSDEEFGGFGGFSADKEDAVEEEVVSHGPKSIKSVSTPSRSRHSSKVQTVLTPLEKEIAKINEIRMIHRQGQLLRFIEEKITEFDANFHLLRTEKTYLDVDLKMADLRQITLLEEFLILKEYEKRETTLSGRVASKRMELNDMNAKVSEMQVKLEAKRRDIEKLADREKALYANFGVLLGENNKFQDFLNKVFRKKIKRAKKKKQEEGDDEDGSDMSSEEESDWSSEEEEDDSVEGGFDDSVCPPGCDEQLFNDVLELREKRLDLEEALVEEKKLAEQQKKDMEGLSKKSKIMENQLKTAEDALEEFQVEKQGKLNELDVVVPLRLNQVEHVSNGAVPADLSSCLVFTNKSLTGLQRRIKELQHEKAEQRSFFKEARMQHVRLIKDRKIMEQKTEHLEEKCEQMMLLKFGRVVDLDKLDSVTINRTVEELKQKVHQNELKNSAKLSKMDTQISDLKDQITQLTRENTHHLDKYNVLTSEKTRLEKNLDQRQKDLKLDEQGESKSDLRERQRLMQLVQLQAQEVQALKEEIGLLSRKGGHILPPAQPPIGREEEI